MNHVAKASLPDRRIRLQKRNRVRIVLAVVSAGIAGVLLLFLGTAFFQAQRADYGWDPDIATPAFPAEHPRVLIDEGHHNASTVGITASTIIVSAALVRRIRPVPSAQALVITSLLGWLFMFPCWAPRLVRQPCLARLRLPL